MAPTETFAKDTVNQNEFNEWFHKLKVASSCKTDFIEASPKIVEKLENDYPDCFHAGYFLYHGVKVVPEGKREEVEEFLNLTVEEKMHQHAAKLKAKKNVGK